MLAPKLPSVGYRLRSMLTAASQVANWFDLQRAPSALQFAFLAALLGAIDAGLVIGWRQIEPGHVAWLRKDPAVYQAAWDFLRHAPWTFPPTWLPHLDFPFGISASYLDVIPLVAIPLKLVSPLLANHFQYFGLYVVVCLVLQAWFASRLMSRFTADKPIIIIGMLFFLNSPILLMRLYGHFSLCSQWLIIAALYYYFAPVHGAGSPKRLWPLFVLLAVSGGTSPYLSLMVLGVALAAVARISQARTSETTIAPADSLRERKPSQFRSTVNHALHSPLASAAALIITLLLSLTIFGFVTLGSMPRIIGGGYGAYSMNVLAPINPSGSSIIFRSFAVPPLQAYEGYNYLGAGILVLGGLCLARDPSLLINLWRRPLRPLLIMSLVFSMAAISARVVVGQQVVGTIPLPCTVLDMLAVFRSSGRFFWPVHELLTLGALVGCLMVLRKRWAARMTLVAVLCLQFFDLLPIRVSVAHESSLFNHTPLHAPIWWVLAKSHVHLVILPARQCDSAGTPGGDAAWPWFAELAAKTGMTLNSVHAARFSVASDQYNCRTLPLEVAQGKLQSDTTYVLDDRLALLVAAHNRTHVCRRIDAFNLCTFASVRGQAPP